jgi:hypothetical protein
LGIFSLQPDESTDVCDVSQLLVFIRTLVVFNDGNIEEVKVKKKGKDITVTGLGGP